MNWVSRYLAILESREQLKRERWEQGVRFETEDRAKASQPIIAAVPAPTAEHMREARRMEPIPEDVEAVIMQESEVWAQEEQRADYRRRYMGMGDWNRVRASIGIGTIDQPA